MLLASAGSAQAALRAPGLQAPGANASVESLPTFTWRAVKGAAQYEFQLSADSKFGAIVLGKGKGKGSQLVRNTAATLHKSVPDGKYFWRVRAISTGDRAGSWSRARTLIKAWKATPKLVAPADELSVAWPSLPLLLRWTPVPHATHYLVSLATDPSLAQSVTTGNRSLETEASKTAL